MLLEEESFKKGNKEKQSENREIKQQEYVTTIHVWEILEIE